MDYIRATCLKCKDPALRDYLVQHSESSFSSDEKEAWDMVKVIANHEEKFQYVFVD